MRVRTSPVASRLRRALVPLTATALAVSGLSLGLGQPAAASPDGTGLVISEVYGAGGNSGAVYNADFVEVMNPTADAVDLRGLYVAYRSATGGFGGSLALRGSLPAGGRYLVRMSATGANGAALPTPDRVANPTISMATAGGQVFLQQTAAPVVGTGEMAGQPGVVDMVGLDSSASGSTSFEGAPGPAATATQSANRDAAGADTDNNATDFSLAAPSPSACGCVPAGGTFSGSIADIQGTDTDTSPHLDDTVTTRGVVTAVYATGGFNGFYMQTEGTGGATDATPGASDAIFVFGTSAMASSPVAGDFVEVTGPVTEFAGTTEIVPGAGGVTKVNGDAHTDPTALADPLPGSDCDLGACPGVLDVEADREAHEGELLAPAGPFTVTNSFSLTNGANGFMEIGLAADDVPLFAPTEVEDFQTGAIAERTAYNNAHAITLDDGSSQNYTTSSSGVPMPWLTAGHTVRVGAAATFQSPVVLEYRNNGWRLQPRSQVTDTGAGTVTFEQNRPAAPDDVGGDVRLGTFNVLNYFNTTGEAYNAAHPGACTFFNDRAGNPVSVNTCTPTGPRGAAQADDLQRQQDKIVTAINDLGADIVSLEEIENSVALGEADRDDAVSTLVTALNAAAGSTRWAFAPSPAAADLPDLAEQDVIRTAFIYDPSTIELVGASRVLVGSAPFANAREPLAQVFKRKGGRDRDGFAVVVNHFKSKGATGATGDNLDTGQGAYNGDRIRQAEALVAFADAFAADRGVARVLLTGDFNSYSKEDPVQAIEASGYHLVESSTPGEESYSFSGLSGSLDHVFANEAAMTDVAGADIWDINASEPIAYQYSRFNYNVTDVFDGTTPYAASDHNPEIVGIRSRDPHAPIELNLLGINDFHGRIFENSGGQNNTVKWAGTIEKLTADAGARPTLLVGAGDLIGASLFPSAVQQDQPTIDILNALGLDASAVGNHEFDRGWADLRDRVIGDPGARNAQWDYLGANVYAKGTTDPVLPEYALFDLDGVSVAVVGAVTEETSTLVSPGGITEIDFGNPVDAVNRVAGELSDGDPGNGEAQVIIASFHAGALQGVGSTYEEQVANGGEFAEMAGLDPTVDVIFNGHTHQVYAWDAPIPGGGGSTRPILQTGQYADNVGQVTLSVDPDTGDVVGYQARNVARLTTPDADLVAAYPRVAQVKQIVDAALVESAAVGNQPVGEIAGDVTRAFSNGSYVNGVWVSPTPRTEDRLSESSIGDLVGNALRDGIPADMGEPDLGIVNPGGLRADLFYAGDTSSNPANTDGVVTYAEANAVLPFVNNIWLIDLTGAELKQVLEQQWQTNPGGPPPARPFLHLGLSDNVQTTLDPTRPEGSRVTSVTIDGQPLDPAATYTVSTFSFLGTGGDNFRAFTQGTSRDTGLVDRDLWIAYLQDHAPVAPDFARQQVYEAGMPAVVYAGQHVAFTLNRLNLTSIGSPENTSVKMVADDGTTSVNLGTVPVSGGSAAVAFDVPAAFSAGGGWVELTAQPTGTTLRIPIGERGSTTVSGTADPISYGQEGTVVATVEPADATGTVELHRADELLGSALLDAGSASITLGAGDLEPGTYRLRLDYLGDASHGPASGFVTVEVLKATPTVTAGATPTSVKVKKGTTSIDVDVSAAGVEPTGVVAAFVGGSIVASAELTAGSATLTVGPFATIGTKDIEVRYLGDAHVAAGSDTVTVLVVKNQPKVKVTLTPSTAKRGQTRVVVTASVGLDDLAATGSVTIKVDGRTVAVKTLVGGATTVRLDPFSRAGTHTVKVVYDGDPVFLKGSASKDLTVR